MKRNLKKLANITLLILITTFFTSCINKKETSSNYQQEITEMKQILENSALSAEAKYGIINKIATTLLQHEQHTQLIVYLTDWIHKNPSDQFNAYWSFIPSAHLRKGFISSSATAKKAPAVRR